MEQVKVGILEGLMMRSQNLSFKSLFNRNINANAIAGGVDGEKGESSSPSPLNSPRPIPQLSPLANSVVSRCSRSNRSFVMAQVFHFCLYIFCFLLLGTTIFFDCIHFSFLCLHGCF